VECGQLAVCGLAYVAMAPLRRLPVGRRVFLGMSGAGAAAGAFWFVERLLTV
jgi:hypothetical protein